MQKLHVKILAILSAQLSQKAGQDYNVKPGQDFNVNFFLPFFFITSEVETKASKPLFLALFFDNRGLLSEDALVKKIRNT